MSKSEYYLGDGTTIMVGFGKHASGLDLQNKE